jgi:drug/metabolite transporter (DMT)-like permease
MTVLWDLALVLPPITRFFVGLLLVLVVVGSAVGFTAWIYSHYGEEE